MNVFETLSRHQSRRFDGIPTITALVGPIGLSMNFWRKWSGEFQRPAMAISSRDVSIRSILHSWLPNVCVHGRLMDFCGTYLADRIGRMAEPTVSELKRKSRYEVELWLNNAFPGGSSNEAERLCFHILRRNTTTLSIDDLDMFFGEADDELARSIHGISRILPANEIPSILVFQEKDALDFKSIRSALGLLEKIAVENLAMPLAMAIESGHYRSFLYKFPESRAKTLMKEAVVIVESLDVRQIRELFDHSPEIQNPPLSVAVQRLAADGASRDLTLHFREAVRAVSASTSEDMVKSEKARSAAEQFLFNRLETHPETSGLFELNGRLDFKFGSRRIEIDLISKRYRIAIEIDGYYHFLNAEAYRKDRVKDLMLQKNGYMVIRFMASDVVEKLSVVLDTILETLKFRKLPAKDGGMHE